MRTQRLLLLVKDPINCFRYLNKFANSHEELASRVPAQAEPE